MTKSPNDFAQVKFRPGFESALETALKDRAEQQLDSAYSQVARRDLGRYYTLLKRSLPTFSEPEALVIVGALKGSRIDPEIIHRLYVDVDEELEDHPVEGINRGAFVARLRNLSRLECMAIADAAERFWLGEYHKSGDEVSQRLREVGLVHAQS